MVVLKFVGLEWKIDEKICLSLSDQKSFRDQITSIYKKLELPNFDGFALYRVETHPKTSMGPPNFYTYINPTVPVDLKSNPMKEKMKAGTLLWIKRACSEKQAFDREKHQALLDFREKHGIDGLQKDGEDLIDFRIDQSSTLNAAKSADILEFENEQRLVVDIAEFKSWQAITFETRVVQRLSDDELEARNKLFSEAVAELQQESSRLQGMMVNERVGSISTEETVVRRGVNNEEESDRSKILQRSKESRNDIHDTMRQKEQADRASELAAVQATAMAVAAANAKPSMDKEEFEQILEKQREQYQTMVAGLETKLSGQFMDFSAKTNQALEMILSDHNQHLMRKRSADATANDELLDSQLHKLEYKLEKELPQQLAVFYGGSEGKNQEEDDQIAELLREQNKLMAEMLEAEQDALKVEVEAGQQTRAVLEDSLLTSLQSTQLSLQQQLTEVTRQCDAQANDLQELEVKYNESVARERDRHNNDENGQYSLGGTPTTLVSPGETPTPTRFGRSDPKNTTISLGYLPALHPQVFSCIHRFIELFVSLDPELLSDAAAGEEAMGSAAEEKRAAEGFGVGSVSGRRLPPFINSTSLRSRSRRKEGGGDDPSGYDYSYGGAAAAAEDDGVEDHYFIGDGRYTAITPTRVAKSFALDLYVALRSPYAVCDYLCAHTGSRNDPEVRHRLLKLCEEHTPHLCSVLELLLVLYRDREAELALFVLGGDNSNNTSSSRQQAIGSSSITPSSYDFQETIDHVSGSPFYYCHRVQFGQWSQPPNFVSGVQGVTSHHNYSLSPS